MNKFLGRKLGRDYDAAVLLEQQVDGFYYLMSETGARIHFFVSRGTEVFVLCRAVGSLANQLGKGDVAWSYDYVPEQNTGEGCYLAPPRHTPIYQSRRQAHKAGLKIIKVLGLYRYREGLQEGRVETNRGTKTPVGLTELVQRVLLEEGISDNSSE